MFKGIWLGQYDLATFDRDGGIIVQSWDTGNKTGENNAFSVCVTALVLGKLIYILDVYRARLETPDLLKKAKELALQYRPHALLIEDKASGEALIQFLRAEPDQIMHPIGRTPTTDKLTRAQGVSPIVEQRRLFLPTEAPWLGEFKAELLGFPNTRYYDQVDALGQLLEWVRGRDTITPTINAGPEIIGEDEYGNPTHSPYPSDYGDESWRAFL